MEEGIVPGGGVALVRASAALASLSVPEEERYGVQILRRAMEGPARRIAKNAGAEKPEKKAAAPAMPAENF